jgi:hypothetical protein
LHTEHAVGSIVLLFGHRAFCMNSMAVEKILETPTSRTPPGNRSTAS